MEHLAPQEGPKGQQKVNNRGISHGFNSKHKRRIANCSKTAWFVADNVINLFGTFIVWLRINSAKDDAAGLAISERFTAQIKGLNQGVRNANDGISLAQTAEGALKEVTSNLQRIRELAVQSANATNSTSDRQSLQIEVQALLDEIDRVSTDTKFNGTAIIDGSFANQAFQVGANSGETVSITSIGSSKTADLGGSYSSTLTSGAVDGSGISAGDVFVNGIDAGASADDGVSTVNADGSALAIATAINTTTSQSGVSATATTEKVAAADYTGGTSGEVNFITINDTNVSWSNGADATATGSAVIDAINDKTATTGVTAALDTSTGRIGLTAADGRTIEIGASISTNGAAVSGFSASTTTYGTVTYTGSSIAGIQLNDDAADAVADGSSAVTAADANGHSVRLQRRPPQRLRAGLIPCLLQRFLAQLQP